MKLVGKNFMVASTLFILFGCGSPTPSNKMGGVDVGNPGAATPAFQYHSMYGYSFYYPTNLDVVQLSLDRILVQSTGDVKSTAEISLLDAASEVRKTEHD